MVGYDNSWLFRQHARVHYAVFCGSFFKHRHHICDDGIDDYKWCHTLMYTKMNRSILSVATMTNPYKRAVIIARHVSVKTPTPPSAPRDIFVYTLDQKIPDISSGAMGYPRFSILKACSEITIIADYFALKRKLPHQNIIINGVNGCNHAPLDLIKYILGVMKFELVIFNPHKLDLKALSDELGQPQAVCEKLEDLMMTISSHIDT